MSRANRLREQIDAERGGYVTRAALEAANAKIDAELKPVLAFMASQQGRSAGIGAQTAMLMTMAGLIIAALSVALVIVR